MKYAVIGAAAGGVGVNAVGRLPLRSVSTPKYGKKIVPESASSMLKDYNKNKKAWNGLQPIDVADDATRDALIALELKKHTKAAASMPGISSSFYKKNFKYVFDAMPKSWSESKVGKVLNEVSKYEYQEGYKEDVKRITGLSTVQQKALINFQKSPYRPIIGSVVRSAPLISKKALPVATAIGAVAGGIAGGYVGYKRDREEEHMANTLRPIKK